MSSLTVGLHFLAFDGCKGRPVLFFAFTIPSQIANIGNAILLWPLGFWIGFFQQVSERFRERQRRGWKACRKSRIPLKDSEIGGTRAHNSQHPRQLLIPDTKIWPESSTGAHFPGCRISFPYSKICWRFGRGYGARNDGQVNLQFQMKLKYNKNVTQVFDLKTGYCLHFTASPRCIDTLILKVKTICKLGDTFLNIFFLVADTQNCR